MQLDLIRLKAEHEKDIEALRNMVFTLIKCLGPDSHDEGYCVVNDRNPLNPLHYCSREQCIAFIKGYEAASTGYPSLTEDDSELCVCVNTPSLMIVIPEKRLGEPLRPSKL
jgi:hypothetical protein